jgi:CHASE3 domain sensor protein
MELGRALLSRPPEAGHEIRNSKILQDSRSWQLVAPADCLQPRSREAHPRASDSPCSVLPFPDELDRRSHRKCGRARCDLAQQASIEMLEARRAERNFLLLRDANYLVANQQSINNTQQILDRIRSLEPGEYPAVQKASEAIAMYRERFAAALPALEQPAQGPTDRVQAVVRAYERDLNDLLKRSKHSKRGQLLEELRKRVGSFDAQISATVQDGNPELQRVTEDLQASSQEILREASLLESVNWDLVQKDHAEAGHLIRQAERALGIVSFITVVISVWVSYALPHQVIKPLVNLKEAIGASGKKLDRISLSVLA